MAHKRHGQLTVLGEWARHFRRDLGRRFWKRERAAEKVMLQSEIGERSPGTAEEASLSERDDNPREANGKT
jgi:hypothetical protein